jgi:hypothetical protein
MNGNTEDKCMADDFLEGAEAVAAFLYGDPGQRRKVYHLDAKGELPTFRLGSKLCSTKTAIRQHIAELTKKSAERAGRVR